MLRNITKANVQVMYRISVISLAPDEIQSPSERKEREAFDAAIEKKYGLPMTSADFKDNPDYAVIVTPAYDFYDCYEYDEVPASNMPDIDNVKDKDEVDIYDQYV
jgi:hypothetical protein